MLNTDIQALECHGTAAVEATDAFESAEDSEKASNAIRGYILGQEALQGRGAGGKAANGAAAAEAASADLCQELTGADIVFITAGMGGGTGSGAAPKVARIAKGLGAVTVALVSTPFHFEGRARAAVAEDAIAELAEHVDVLVVVHNEKLMVGALAGALDCALSAWIQR